ncbi:hypothetical protein D3C87_1290650 [compost metagenome]
MILGQAVVHVAAQRVVGLCLFVQRHADAPDNAAKDLAASHFRIDHPACGDCTDDPVDLDDAQVFVDQYLDEHRRVSRGGIGFAFLVGFGVHLNLDRLFPAVPGQVGQCHPRLAEGQLPIFENGLFSGYSSERRRRLPGDGEQFFL